MLYIKDNICIREVGRIALYLLLFHYMPSCMHKCVSLILYYDFDKGTSILLQALSPLAPLCGVKLLFRMSARVELRSRQKSSVSQTQARCYPVK